MKKIAIVICLFSLFQTASANVDSIWVNSVEKIIKIGNVSIAKDSSFASLKSLLGNPSKVDLILGEYRRYFYDDLGITVELAEGGLLIASITFGYNWDGDKKVSSGQFKGALFIDGFLMNDTKTGEDVKTNTQIKKLTCIGESLCMTNPKEKGMMTIIGFKNKKITQVGFGFF